MNGFEEMEKKLEKTGKMNRLKAIAESNDGKALADACSRVARWRCARLRAPATPQR